MTATTSHTQPTAADEFDATAAVYDAFTAHHDYEDWTRMIEGLARRHGLADGGRLLDVGCGTGKSFLPWLARGWRVTGCDFSAAMLAEAALKAPDVPLVHADARRLGVLGSFDLVLALDDVVNYLAPDELAAAFAGVARNLAPDGLFVFDANTLHTLRTFFSETHEAPVPGGVVTWCGQGSPDLPPGGATEAVMEARTPEGVLRSLFREHHHPVDVLARELAAAGLELLAAYGQDEDGATREAVDELEDTKAIVIARPAPVPTYVLQETVEAFPATDGSIYFLRGGSDAEQVIPDPTAAERAVLELLHAPRTEDELRAAAEGDPAELLRDLQALGLVTDRPGRPSTLPADARRRFDRQLPYFEATGPVDAEEAQRRLMAATVVIVGCGGLGSWTAANLACTGLGHLVLVDDDTVELSNLNRQLLFRHADVGRRKVDAAADALRAFDPALCVTKVHRRVRGVQDVVDLAEGADLIVATADHPPYAIARWIDEASARLGVPHVSAAQFPPSIRVGPLFVPGATGCLHCQEAAARREFPEFDALVRYRETHDRASATVGPLSGLVGSLLATDAMHLITGVATPATQGRALVVDTRDLSVEIEEAVREPDCPVCA